MQNAAWVRFKTVYAPLIRRLDVSFLEAEGRTREEILHFINMLSADFQTSLTNVTDIRFCWSSDPELSLQRIAWLFVGPSVTSFKCVVLATDDDQEDQTDAFLTSLPTRMPLLQHLSLRVEDMCSFRSRFMNTGFAPMLSALPRLRSLDLPAGLQAFHVQGSRRWKIFGP